VSIRIDSLRADRSRIPIPPRLSRGNHPASAFYAELFEWSVNYGRDLPAMVTTPADLELLLFCQDFPITIEVDSWYSTFTTPFTANYKDFVEGPFDLDADRADVSIIQPQTTTAGLLEQTQGLTPYGVEVSGFLCRGSILDRGIYTGGTKDKAIQIHAEVRSSAPVQHGPMAYWASSDSFGYRPILLNSWDYTQTMRDDGDRIVELAGGLTTVYCICGLWCIHAIKG